MSRPNTLYKLSVIADDPWVSGFAMDDLPSVLGNDSLEEDMTAGFGIASKQIDWSQHKFGDRWNPPAVYDRPSGPHDYPCINLIEPAFSQRAIDTLNGLLTENGELLPLAGEGHGFYYFNALKIANVLDRKKTKLNFMNEAKTIATSIDHFHFIENRLEGLDVFRIPENPSTLIVSDRFVRVAREGGLVGMSFRQLWPYSGTKNWRIDGNEILLT